MALLPHCYARAACVNIIIIPSKQMKTYIISDVTSTHCVESTGVVTLPLAMNCVYTSNEGGHKVFYLFALFWYTAE